jgi:hypothetical protein
MYTALQNENGVSCLIIAVKEKKYIGLWWEKPYFKEL